MRNRSESSTKLSSLMPAVWVIVLLLFTIISAKAQDVSVTGKVVMPDGTPALGAKVEVRNLWWDRTARGSGETDESGEFTVTLRTGRYWLHAALDNLVVFQRDPININEPGATAGPFELRLVKGCVISGKIVDGSTGDPIEGARLISHMGDVVFTSADGSYTLVVPRIEYSVGVIKEGYHRPVTRFDPTDKETMEFDFELKPGGTIKGIVVGRDNKPLRDADVSQHGGTLYFESTKTNADGEFLFEGVDLDEGAVLRLSADLHETVDQHPVAFAPGETEVSVHVALVAQKTRTITGRVVDADGSPVHRAIVRSGRHADRPDSRETSTDADGRYVLENVGEQMNAVMAHAEGFGPSFEILEEGQEDAVIDFEIKPGLSVAGWLEDEDGDPIEGAHVAVVLDLPINLYPDLPQHMVLSMNRYRFATGFTTDKEGRFEIADLPEGNVAVEVYKDGFVGFSTNLTAGKDDNVLVMYPPGNFSGTVLCAETNEFITSFAVFVRSSRGRPFESPEGKFTLSDPNQQPGDRADVSVRAPGYLLATIEGVAATKDEDYDSAVFRLNRSFPYEGTITDTDGNPLEGVLVEASPSQHLRYGVEIDDNTAVTGPDGKFRLTDTVHVIGDLSISKENYARLDLNHVNFRRPLKAVLQQGGSIRGKLLDDNGEPMPNASVFLRGDRHISWERSYMRTDSDGLFEYDALSPGKYRLEAQGIHMVEVKPGEVTEVDWDKASLAEIEGTVTLDGKPLPRARLSLFPGDERHYNAVAGTDADGRYTLSVPDTGPHRLTVYSTDSWEGLGRITHTLNIEVEPGKNLLDIEFPRGSVSGMLMSASGKPVSEAKLRLQKKITAEEISVGPFGKYLGGPQFRYSSESVTDSDGAFTFSALTPGEFLITAEIENVAVPIRPAFHLSVNQQLEDVVVRIPPLGEARLMVVDADSGEPLKGADALSMHMPETDYIIASVTNDLDISFSPLSIREADGIRFNRTPDGKLVFVNLPEGEYSVNCISERYRALPMTFEVKGGEITEVVLKMAKSERIIFRYDGIIGMTRLGVSLKTEDGQPVAVPALGWGFITGFRGDVFPQELAIPVEPGTYILEAELFDADFMSTSLWHTEQTVVVETGKDTIIEIILDEI